MTNAATTQRGGDHGRIMQATSGLNVRTHDNVSVQFATAGLGSRSLAWFVDTLIFLPLGIVIVYGGSRLLSLLIPDDNGIGQQVGESFSVLAPVLTALLAYAFYFIIAEGLSGGRTPGKRVVGVRVVRTDGSSIGLAQAAFRGLVRSPLLLLADYCIGPFLLIFQPQSRRLGDLIAGTVVVRERQTSVSLNATVATAVYLHSAQTGPAISGVERLTTHDLSTLRTFLSHSTLHPVQRFRIAGALATKLQDKMELPPDASERVESPELFVERLYLQLAAIR